MANVHHPENRRREFLRGLARYPLLAGMGLLAGRLIAKTQGGPLNPKENCISRGVCRGCGQLAACGQPAAAMTRQVLENGRRLP